MKLTLDIDDGLVERAIERTGVTDTEALVRLGLESLVASASARRLAARGNSEPGARLPRRARSSKR